MLRTDFQIEVCANSVESCLEAQSAGANRVELCVGEDDGGITPSYGEILIARRLLNKCKLHVLIRPRGGDFVYSQLELEKMAADIDLCRQLNVDGVVLGCLTQDGKVDMEKNQLLLSHCKGMQTTFHRAFDHTEEPFQALSDIIQLGFHRVLTSGQQPTAAEGVQLLAELHKRAEGRIGIMAGCGVNEWNIREIQHATQLSEFHFSARQQMLVPHAYSNRQVYMGKPGKEENRLMRTSRQRVEATISALL